MAHAPSAAWLDRFTMRLGHLLPSVTIDEAAEIALTTYVDTMISSPKMQQTSTPRSCHRVTRAARD